MTTEPENSAPEPMPITTALASLLVLSHDHKLPPWTGVRAEKGARHLKVEVACLTDVNAWADALAIPDTARHSSVYADRSEIHGAWDNDWHGWHLRVVASIDATPDVVVEAGMLAALEVISKMPTPVAATPSADPFDDEFWVFATCLHCGKQVQHLKENGSFWTHTEPRKRRCETGDGHATPKMDARVRDRS